MECRERLVCRCRFLCVEIERTEKSSAAVLRRRLRRAGKILHRAGVREVVLPEGVEREAVEALGLSPVSTLPLRRMLAADWASALLAQRGVSPAGAKVAVAADTMSGEVVRTVTELALRHRYVLLELERGGENLCRHLRREYGIALQLSPTGDQLAEADVIVLFAPCPKWRGGTRQAVLRLDQETDALPPLALPPEIEGELPPGVVREQLIAALWRAGSLRPGQIALARGGQTAPLFPAGGEACP